MAMAKEYDYLLVGAGLFNAVFAHLAKQHGKRCLIVEKRSHIGGNLYCENIEGICVHQYGPHIFHTDNKKVWDFVNSFVDFNRFTLCTLAYNNGKLYNMPFNMNTFYQLWGVTNPIEAERVLESQRTKVRNPANLEEQAMSLVGRDVFKILIKDYTEKQWGRSCKELPASIIQRLPVRLTFDNNYFNDRFQGIPEGGYNILINKLLEDFEYIMDCDYLDNRYELNDKARRIIYSGPIDAFYDYTYGHLEYRSLRFEHEFIHSSNWQGNAIINYPTHEFAYTRIVEHKHFDVNNKEAFHAPYTVITREYPLAFDTKGRTEPYYPVNDQVNKQLHARYLELSKQECHVLFGGRLAEYRYYDMDDTIESAMNMFEQETFVSA